MDVVGYNKLDWSINTAVHGEKGMVNRNDLWCSFIVYLHQNLVFFSKLEHSGQFEYKCRITTLMSAHEVIISIAFRIVVGNIIFAFFGRKGLIVYVYFCVGIDPFKSNENAFAFPSCFGNKRFAIISITGIKTLIFS
ncbi:hypothetical protein D3C81_924990 [compost metagenome]